MYSTTSAMARTLIIVAAAIASQCVMSAPIPSTDKVIDKVLSPSSNVSLFDDVSKAAATVPKIKAGLKDVLGSSPQSACALQHGNDHPLDSNHDGYISQDESGFTDREWRNAFAMHDPSGHVSQATFDEYTKKAVDAVAKKDSRKASKHEVVLAEDFRMRDHDGNGKIELGEALSFDNDIDGWKSTLEEFDKDGDSAISAKEFAKLSSQHAEFLSEREQTNARLATTHQAYQKTLHATNLLAENALAMPTATKKMPSSKLSMYFDLHKHDMPDDSAQDRMALAIKMFEKVDANGDGQVTAAEYIDAAKQAHAPLTELPAHVIDSAIHSDGDQELSAGDKELMAKFEFDMLDAHRRKTFDAHDFLASFERKGWLHPSHFHAAYVLAAESGHANSMPYVVTLLLEHDAVAASAAREQPREMPCGAEEDKEQVPASAKTRFHPEHLKWARAMRGHNAKVNKLGFDRDMLVILKAHGVTLAEMEEHADELDDDDEGHEVDAEGNHVEAKWWRHRHDPHGHNPHSHNPHFHNPSDPNVLNECLINNGWRTETEVSEMNQNDKRNTVIHELNPLLVRGESGLQGKNDHQLSDICKGYYSPSPPPPSPPVSGDDLTELTTEENIELQEMAFAEILASMTKIRGTGFCWRDAYDRGAGRPATCKSSGDYPDARGAMCYKNCETDGCPADNPNCGDGQNGNPHYHRKGMDIEFCQAHCPAGTHDNGLYCVTDGLAVSQQCCARCWPKQWCCGSWCCGGCGHLQATGASYTDTGCFCQPDWKLQGRFHSPGVTKYNSDAVGCADNEDPPTNTVIGNFCYPKPRPSYECWLTTCQVKCPAWMVECGPGACAAHAQECGTIVTMAAFSVGSAILSSLTLVMSSGAGAAGPIQAARETLSAAQQTMVKKGAQLAKKMSNSAKKIGRAATKSARIGQMARALRLMSVKRVEDAATLASRVLRQSDKVIARMRKAGKAIPDYNWKNLGKNAPSIDYPPGSEAERKFVEKTVTDNLEAKAKQNTNLAAYAYAQVDEEEDETKFDYAVLDITGLTTAVRATRGCPAEMGGCSKKSELDSDSYTDVEKVAAWVNVFAVADPTGWVGAAAAFMHPMCSDKYGYLLDDEINQLLNKCVYCEKCNVEATVPDDCKADDFSPEVAEDIRDEYSPGGELTVRSAAAFTAAPHEARSDHARGAHASAAPLVLAPLASSADHPLRQQVRALIYNSSEVDAQAFGLGDLDFSSPDCGIRVSCYKDYVNEKVNQVRDFKNNAVAVVKHAVDEAKELVQDVKDLHQQLKDIKEMVEAGKQCFNLLPGSAARPSSPLQALKDMKSAIDVGSFSEYMLTTYIEPIVLDTQENLKTAIDTAKALIFLNISLIKDGQFDPSMVTGFHHSLIQITKEQFKTGAFQCLQDATNGGFKIGIEELMQAPLAIKMMSTAMVSVHRTFAFLITPDGVFAQMMDRFSNAVRTVRDMFVPKWKEMDEMIAGAISDFGSKERHMMIEMVKEPGYLYDEVGAELGDFCASNADDKSLADRGASYFTMAITRVLKYVVAFVMGKVDEYVFQPMLAGIITTIGAAQGMLSEGVIALCGLIPLPSAPAAICASMAIPISILAEYLMGLLSQQAVKGFATTVQEWAFEKIDTLAAKASQKIGDHMRDEFAPELDALEEAEEKFDAARALVAPVITMVKPMLDWVIQLAVPAIHSAAKMQLKELRQITSIVKTTVCAGQVGKLSNTTK